jgi:hypothetical protein
MSLSLVIVAVLALVAGLLRGGSLEALADTRVRWLLLLFEGLLVQVVFDVWDPPGLTASGALAVLVVSNVAVACFVALNLRVAGMWLIGLGLVANTTVIATNGAMPVSAGAAQTAGLEAPSEVDDDLKHERLDENTGLPWLGDVIPVPGLKEVLSVGDLLLAAGIGWLIYVRTTAGRASAKADAASG